VGVTVGGRVGVLVGVCVAVVVAVDVLVAVGTGEGVLLGSALAAGDTGVNGVLVWRADDMPPAQLATIKASSTRIVR